MSQCTPSTTIKKKRKSQRGVEVGGRQRKKVYRRQRYGREKKMRGRNREPGKQSNKGYKKLEPCLVQPQ
jgi:hypothetical protein